MTKINAFAFHNKSRSAFNKNDILHKSVVTRSSSIFTAFWDNNGFSDFKLSQNFGSVRCSKPIQFPYIYIYIYIYRERERENDNKVIQAAEEIYWETKSTLCRFGSNEPSSGRERMILGMLNQRWMFKKYKNLWKINLNCMSERL